ncbi:hypothetical protein SARC_13922, partial [Sphaeroforma arctica JP610]
MNDGVDSTSHLADGKESRSSIGIQDKHELDIEEDTESSSKEEEKPKLPSVPFFQLFKFADKYDMAMISVAIISSCIHGAMMALFATVFGDIFDSYD